MNKHPSGKPIHKPKIGIISQSRCPFDMPLSPGLRRPNLAQAVGFTAGWPTDEDDSIWMKKAPK